MITLFFAGSLTILAIVLAYLTGRKRIKTCTSLGIGEDIGMLQITRAHGNLLEKALFFLILSFLLETIAQASNLALMILGDIFLLSIIAHAYGLTIPGANSQFRFLGMAGTILVLGIQSVWALIISINWLISNNFGL